MGVYDILSARQTEAPTVTLTPPANVIRRQAGLGVPSARDVAEATFGVLAGAAITATFVTLVPGPAKWVAALATGALGVILTSASPLGTIPEELGMGALAAAASWIFFDVTGQYSIPPTRAATPATAGLLRAGSAPFLPAA
jgi:hypothetical protein